MKSKILGLLTMGLLAGPMVANATFINGSLSFAGGFDSLPAAPTGSIVSLLSVFSIDVVGIAGGGTFDLVPETGLVTASPFSIPPGAGQLMFLTKNGFAWTMLVVKSDANTPLECANGTCVDSRTFDIMGTVVGPGFDATEFNGTWVAFGSCTGADKVCTGGVTGSYSAGFTTFGDVVEVPEPGTLALLGLGLAGLGLSRRRKA